MLFWGGGGEEGGVGALNSRQVLKLRITFAYQLGICSYEKKFRIVINITQRRIKFTQKLEFVIMIKVYVVITKQLSICIHQRIVQCLFKIVFGFTQNCRQIGFYLCVKCLIKHSQFQKLRFSKKISFKLLRIITNDADN